MGRKEIKKNLRWLQTLGTIKYESPQVERVKRAGLELPLGSWGVAKSGLIGDLSTYKRCLTSQDAMGMLWGRAAGWSERLDLEICSGS